MGEYKLSRRADEQLEEIYIFTTHRFGEQQAEAYHEGFHRAFGLIADFPFMGQSADELIPGWRQFKHGSHLIFYKTSDDGWLVIELIVHGAQRIHRHMFDE